MCNWFKKMFGCKCHCEKDHCECCSKEEEKSAENAPVTEVKPEVTPESAPEKSNEENIEQA